MLKPARRGNRDTSDREKAMLRKVIDYLRQIGLAVHEVSSANGFVPGCRIRSGALCVDSSCTPSALLHEAGHLATVPARFRGLMSDNLATGMRHMFDQLTRMQLEPDHPLWRAAVQCSDPEATAWAWAAGLAIGLEAQTIIQDAEYDGSGAEIRAMLQAGQYVGINGLAHAGMCRRGHWVAEEFRYPRMQHWLQAA